MKPTRIRPHLFVIVAWVACLGVACASHAPAPASPVPPADSTPATRVAPAPAVPAAATPDPAPTPQAGSPAAARPARPSVPPLTGEVTRAVLENYPGWEQLRAQDYTPDPAAIDVIRTQWADTDLLWFVATWCPDSRREVPRFFKILDLTGFPAARLTLHALDRTKKDAAGLTVKWNVERVPTFIVVRDGREIGRIVERPAATLEADLQKILAGRP